MNFPIGIVTDICFVFHMILWNVQLKPTYPDFKHKDDGDALWLNSAPSWVLPMLPPQPTVKNVNNR